MTIDYDVGVALASIVALIIISAFFSGSETGLTTASRARLNELERRGNNRAKTVLKLTSMPERLIGSLLLGNTLANITASAVATAALVKVFSDSGAVIASVALTVIILIFAEVMPKTYAIAYPERVALAVAPIMRLIAAILGPIVMTVEYIVKKTLMVFGVDTSNVESILSAHDEIRGAIDLHQKEGSMVKKDRDMLGGILDLKDLEVMDIMVHRTKMNMLDASEPMTEIIQQVLKSGHTRLPVYKDNPDNIIGILHAKSLFGAVQADGRSVPNLKLDDILSPAWFVPDTRPLTDQLNAFLRRKTHFAIVVDEYGEVQGLITLEDIVEEIVGDIKDEFDAVTTGVRKQANGSYNIEGTVPLRDLNRALDWSLPDEEATTIAGLVIHEARIIPDAGQVFTFHGFRFEVIKKRKQQIAMLNVSKVEPASTKVKPLQ
jgi:Mg2+/Co2+ transporter CorB